MAEVALIRTAQGLVPATEADRELRRFSEKVSVSHVTDCWEWQGSRLPRGYGRFRYAYGSMGLAHRWSHERFKGPIPEGMEVDHLCANTCCVNPSHLEVVTPEENRRRAQEVFVPRSTAVRCANGHLWTIESTYMNAKGKRTCKVCRAASEAARRKRIAS